MIPRHQGSNFQGNEQDELRKNIQQNIDYLKNIIENKPSGFFQKLNPFKQDKDVLSVTYNGIPLEINKDTTVENVLVQYSKGKEELFSNLKSDVNNLNMNMRHYVETESWSVITKELSSITKVMSSFRTEIIPADIKNQLTSTLKYSELLNDDPDMNSHKSHLGFVAQQVVHALKSNERGVLTMAYGDLVTMNQRNYNDMPTMVAVALNNLSDTCSNFHASKIGPFTAKETKSFVETVAQCAETIFNDDSMSRGLKEKCIQRMCDTLKYAGFESNVPTIKPEELNQTNLIKFNIGQLLHYSNIKNYDVAAYAPTTLRNYTKVPPELPKAHEQDAYLEKYIQNAQSAKPTAQQPTLESTSLSV